MKDISGLSLGRGWNKGIKGYLNNRICPKCGKITSPIKPHVCKPNIPWNKGLTKKDDPRLQKVSNALTGIKRCPESIEKSRVNAGKRIREQYKNGERVWWGYNPKNKAILNRAYKKGLGSESSRRKAFLANSRHKINKLERYFQDEILDKHFPCEWKFVGDGKTRIGRKFPDFLHTRQKKVILVNGLYWHSILKNLGLSREEVEKREQEPYIEVGYQVLHVWEDELAEVKNGKYIFHKDINRVLTKINNFSIR